MTLSTVHTERLEDQAPNLGTSVDCAPEMKQIWATEYLSYLFLSNSKKKKKKKNGNAV